MTTARRDAPDRGQDASEHSTTVRSTLTHWASQPCRRCEAGGDLGGDARMVDRLEVRPRRGPSLGVPLRSTAGRRGVARAGRVASCGIDEHDVRGAEAVQQSGEHVAVRGIGEHHRCVRAVVGEVPRHHGIALDGRHEQSCREEGRRVEAEPGGEVQHPARTGGREHAGTPVGDVGTGALLEPVPGEQQAPVDPVALRGQPRQGGLLEGRGGVRGVEIGQPAAQQAAGREGIRGVRVDREAGSLEGSRRRGGGEPAGDRLAVALIRHGAHCAPLRIRGRWHST